MKYFVAILALAAVAVADVAHLRGPDVDAQILKQDSDVLPDQYQYTFETSNGIRSQESGVLKNVGHENEGLEVQGSNAYTGPDGAVYSLNYVANEFGYQPVGAHLPTTPAPLPIPDYILRAIEYIRAHPPKPETFSRA